MAPAAGGAAAAADPAARRAVVIELSGVQAVAALLLRIRELVMRAIYADERDAAEWIDHGGEA